MTAPSCVEVVSTTGGAPVTSTTSVEPPTCSEMSTVITSLRLRGMPLRTYFLKPLLAASISYDPTGTSRKMYSPLEPACTSRVVRVASLIRVTVAPTTAPPVGSITVPRMRPPVLCASARGAAKEIARIREKANRMLRPHNEGNREKNSRAFMNSPLATKMLRERIFAVAVPRKPYYNPANLEKVGSCVKQKEFIRRISGATCNAAAAH